MMKEEDQDFSDFDEPGSTIEDTDQKETPSGSGKPVSFWISIFLGFLLVISAGLNLLLIIVTISSAGQFGGGADRADFQEKIIQGEGDDKILVIPLEGPITDQSGGGLFGSSMSPVERVKSRLDRAESDQDVSGVILKVNSPGGGVTASDKIYHQIKQFQKKRKNVTFLAYMENVAASGGYYVSAPADYIMAQRTTVTGSIGVIMQFFIMEGLLKKWDVKPVTITPAQADKKDLGSPFKPMSEDEREIFQGVVEEMYDQFVQVTDQGREQLSTEKVRELADGRIYHASQALENGLIDQIGYFDDAVKKVKEMQDLSSATVMKYKKKRSFMDAFQSTVQSQPSRDLTTQVRQILLGESPPKFLYLWSPKKQVTVGE